METQTPRLIDANVLRKDIEMLRNKSCFDISEDLTSHDTVGFWAGFEYLAKFIESAPTVETTDDALARLPEMTSVGKTGSGKFAAIMFDEEGTILDDMGFVAKTPLEAVKKLEASINLK